MKRKLIAFAVASLLLATSIVSAQRATTYCNNDKVRAFLDAKDKLARIFYDIKTTTSEKEYDVFLQSIGKEADPFVSLGKNPDATRYNAEQAINEMDVTFRNLLADIDPNGK
jgi:hypothetical protein